MLCSNEEHGKHEEQHEEQHEECEEEREEREECEEEREECEEHEEREEEHEEEHEEWEKEREEHEELTIRATRIALHPCVRMRSASVFAPRSASHASNAPGTTPCAFCTNASRVCSASVETRRGGI